MPSNRRAAFTGLGVLSSVGSDPETFYAALLAGTSGIRPLTLLDASALPHRIAGEIPGFDAKKIVTQKEPRKALKVMARTVQLGVAAAYTAAADAKLTPGTIPADRLGVEFGCVMVATELEDMSYGSKTCTSGPPGTVDFGKWGTDGLRLVPPLWMLKYLPNMPACHVSINHDARGPNNTVTASDAAGLLALGEAYRIVGRNLADAFFVGGCESKLNPVSFARYLTFANLTPRNEPPESAVRPFDATRDGTVLGEGAAVFVLETVESATKRGARIDAELVGFATGFDRGLKGPVFAAVIRRAIEEAGISPADVDHVNAGAGGTRVLDAFEARAIAEVFGTATPVFAPRGHLGSTGAASGLLELAASVLALKHGQLPGTLNHSTPDPACPISVHVGAPRSVVKPYAVKLSTTDMGQCAAVVVKRWAA